LAYSADYLVDADHAIIEALVSVLVCSAEP